MNKFLMDADLKKLPRRTAFKVLVGSHNYNLSTPTSDHDWKEFVFPCFEDYFYNYTHSYADHRVGADDVEYKDVRLLYSLLAKANPAYMEILYSTKVEFETASGFDLYAKLQEMKEEILTWNLCGFFSSTLGHIIQKKTLMYKPTEETRELVEKHGYNTKQLLHLVRLSLLLNKFYKQDFTDYASCVTNNDQERNLLLEIKNGNIQLFELDYYVKSAILDMEELKPKWNELVLKKYPNTVVLAGEIRIFEKLHSLVFDACKEEMNLI